MRRHGLCVLSAVVLLLSVPAWAETIPLAVDFGGVAPGSAHFVKGGIPFARGVLKGHSASRLLEDGEEAPLQTRTLATWPDGSVKWMLVDFQASAKKKYVLEFGKDVTRKAARGPVKTGVDAEDVTVDTGVIRFVVRKSGCGFIDELSFDVNGNGKYEPDEKVVKAADPKTPTRR